MGFPPGRQLQVWAGVSPNRLGIPSLKEKQKTNYVGRKKNKNPEKLVLMQIAQVYTDKQKKQTPGYANSMFVLSQTEGVTQTQDTSACMSEVQTDCFL